MTVKFGEQWVYDGEYLSNEERCYHIEKCALLSETNDWIEHMSNKNWVNMEEFKAGYEYVLKENKIKVK
jgi:hypothetical protein